MSFQKTNIFTPWRIMLSADLRLYYALPTCNHIIYEGDHGFNRKPLRSVAGAFLP